MTVKTRRSLLAASAATVLIFAVAAQAHEPEASAVPGPQVLLSAAETASGADLSLASPKYGTWGFDLAGMDRSVKPGDDFNAYASGMFVAMSEGGPLR